MIRKLSPKEKEIAELIAQDYKNKEIAEKLNITYKSLSTRINLIYLKAGVTCEPKPRERFKTWFTEIYNKGWT